MITLTLDDQIDVTELMKKMLRRIDPNGTHLTAMTAEEAFELMSQDIQVLFLDIELPRINGIEVADIFLKKYPALNIIFVTGHPEYSFQAHGVFPSGFLMKPVDEKDLRRALEHLRYPLTDKRGLVVRCKPFGVFFNGEPLTFRSELTMELFAFLVHKEGAFCTNGELIAVLWDGDPEKEGRLRQLVMDMRSRLEKVGCREIVTKRYGKVALDNRLYTVEGAADTIPAQFGWY